MSGLRLAFMGTPDFALPTLTRLANSDHNLVCVYTQPPRPAGRGKSDRPSPVHEFADEKGIEVRTPKNFKAPEDVENFKSLRLDVAIVAAYGLILPRGVLEAPQFGCINVHGSLLPRWRGAAPIHRAVMAGDLETGITIMQMDEGLDTGDMLIKGEVPIGDTSTTGDLHDRLAGLGADLISEALTQLENGTLIATPQPETGVTYADKIDKEEARIDWSKDATEVDRLIRGLSPFPGAWFESPSSPRPLRIKALRSRIVEGNGSPGQVLNGDVHIACGSGAVQLLELQREGKKVMAAAEFLKGMPLEPGSLVG